MAWPKGKGRKLTKVKQKGVARRIERGEPATAIAAWAGCTAQHIRYLKRTGGA